MSIKEYKRVQKMCGIYQIDYFIKTYILCLLLPKLPHERLIPLNKTMERIREAVMGEGNLTT